MQPIPNPETMSGVVRDARRRRGWTQAELARQAGCHPSAISELETTKTRMPIDRLLDVLGALGLQLVVTDRPREPRPAPWES